jgi:hypothetical protein
MTSMLKPMPGDRPHQGDGHLEAMLSGQPLPENANAELQGVSELLTALRTAQGSGRTVRSGPGPGRVPRDVRQVPVPPSRRPRRRPATLSSLLGAKLAAALAAGAVSLGGVAAAAYTGALPAGLPDLAHTTVGAPAADQRKAAAMARYCIAFMIHSLSGLPAALLRSASAEGHDKV